MSAQEVFVSTDKTKLDVTFIHDYLSKSAYWSKGRSIKEVRTTIENSLCFGLYTKKEEEQIGFARVATDFVVFAWLMDVFIKEQSKGKGYGQFLIDSILNYKSLQLVNGIGLRTSDAQGFYKKFGFSSLSEPETWMFKNNKK